MSNILLIVWDSARAANTSLYGHSRDTTPFLEEFSKSSEVYNSISPGIWTLPSHISMFSGIPVQNHRIRSIRDRIKPKRLIFRELSEKENYSTGLFTQNTWLSEANVGIHEAFDFVSDSPFPPFSEAVNPVEFLFQDDLNTESFHTRYYKYLVESANHENTLKSLYNGIASKWVGSNLTNKEKNQHNGFYYADQFVDWLDNQDGDWAACINLMDSHRPYEPTEEYDKWGSEGLHKIQSEIDDLPTEFLREQEPLWKLHALESLYDGGILQADAITQHIVKKLRDAGEFEDTTVIVTGDHGEGFGEQSFIERPVIEHTENMHPYQFNVPLVINTSSDFAVASSEGFVSLTDVYSLIKSNATGTVEFEFSKKPVCSYFPTNPIDEILFYSEAMDMQVSQALVDEGLITVRVGDELHKYTPREAQHEKTTTDETVDLSIEGSLVDESGNGEESQEVIERLEALGYYES